MTAKTPTPRRPRVALIITSYFLASHADVIATRLIEGYVWGGQHVEARVEVASMYLEQVHPGGDAAGRPDIGVGIARRAGIPRFATVAEAMAVGGRGVEVDGVVIIGEHGDYERNEYGQHLYPRRRLFDTAVAAMVAAGHFVPIFNDKGLSYSAADAVAMVATARRLGIPLAAGSTIPLSWRIPRGTTWPMEAAMTEVVAVGLGPVEAYGFHTLEGMQAFAERRRGGETGVAAVTGHRGARAVEACRREVDSSLLDAALSAIGADPAGRHLTFEDADAVFLVDYADGVRGATITFPGQGIRPWAVACRGPDEHVACQIYLPGAVPDPTEHFLLLVRHIEHMMLTGLEPSPPERTLLTTGMLDFAMRSIAADGERLSTPELRQVAYRASEPIPETGIDEVYPAPSGPSPLREGRELPPR